MNCLACLLAVASQPELNGEGPERWSEKYRPGTQDRCQDKLSEAETRGKRMRGSPHRSDDTAQPCLYAQEAPAQALLTDWRRIQEKLGGARGANRRPDSD